MTTNGLNVVGHPVQRLDALGHVTGRTQFFEDTRPTGLLHLKLLTRTDRTSTTVSVEPQ